MSITKNPFPHIPLKQLGVTAGQFLHHSAVHGPGHVNRVIYHALALAKMNGFNQLMPEIWAAAYIHDLSRRGDGYLPEHGTQAASEQIPRYLNLFLQVGVRIENIPMIAEAVCAHSQNVELRHNPIATVLKDADALDRVRIADLDPKYLRLELATLQIQNAKNLFQQTYNTSDWQTVWDIAVAVYNPYLGLADSVEVNWNPDEDGRSRMLRRVGQGEFFTDDFIQSLRASNWIMNIAKSEILPSIQLGNPVVYMREKAIANVQKTNQFWSIWELEENGYGGWHPRFNDSFEDARACNEMRLFGEICKWTTYGVLLNPLLIHSDQNLRKMYGEKRIHLKPEVLQNASFTIGDSQRNKFAGPYSAENVSILLALYAMADRYKELKPILPGNETARYVELQIHKPLSTSDILKVE